MWDRAKQTCDRPFPLEMECTSPRTREKRGRTLDWTIHGRLEESWSIRATRTGSSWRHWGTRTDQIKSAAFFVRKMEERIGSEYCSTTKTRVRSIWRSNREIQRRSTPRCGERAGRRGASTRLRTGQAADCIARTTAEITGRR